MGKALVIKNVSFSANALDNVSFIEPIPCTGLTLSANTATFEYLGDTVTIVATPVPSNTTDQVVWSSSDDNVASVTNGVITLNGLGEATITAVCGTISATVSISQSSAKVPNYRVQTSSYLTKRSNETPCLVMYGNSEMAMVGKIYNASDELVHVEGGDERNLEAILVPFGALYVSAISSNSTNINFKATAGDPINRTEHLGKYWPTYVGDSSSYISKQAVIPGQVIMLRLKTSDNVSDLVTGVLFSAS